MEEREGNGRRRENEGKAGGREMGSGREEKEEKEGKWKNEGTRMGKVGRQNCSEEKLFSSLM